MLVKTNIRQAQFLKVAYIERSDDAINAAL